MAESPALQASATEMAEDLELSLTAAIAAQAGLSPGDQQDWAPP